MTLLFIFYSICITIVAAILAKDSLNKTKSITNLEKLSKHYSDEIDKRDDKIKLLELQNKELEEECDQLDSIVEQKLFEDFGISKVSIIQSDSFVDGMKKELLDIINNMKDIQKSNKDTRKKVIGDRVRLWDFSFHIVKESKTHSLNINYADKDAIVIATDCNIKTEPFMGFMGYSKILDLCIRYEDGTEVFTSSEYVKRTDSYEK